MKIFKFFILLLFLSLLLLFSHRGFCQTSSQYEKTEREIESEKELRERIEKEIERPEIEKEEEEIIPEAEVEKVFIKQIIVIGVTVFSEDKIREIVAPFENRELSLKEIYKVADLITDLYRKDGYLTTRAYVPPQDLSGGILEIRVLEGKMGRLEIKDNRYFSSELLEKKMRLKEGEYFDYNLLRKSLVKINEHPDRTARAILTPGTEPGQTDVILEIKDRLPIHFGIDYDNFGSHYIGRDRLALTLDHNNITGNDDILALKLQKAEADAYTLESLRYLLPIGYSWELGFYVAYSELKLQEELKDVDARGKNTMFSLFLNNYLKDEEDFDIRLTLGFDYNDAKNYLLGVESSKDEMRVCKISTDLDKSDRYGRTIFVDEFHYGIPDILGGSDSVDSNASRTGSGGKFTKWYFSLIRLQKMPLNSTLLWKNHFQISPYILTATEQFQIGGIRNNRGYPPAEKVGDEGYTSTLELSTHPFFIPKTWDVPFCNKTLYDTLTLIAFYDWGHTHLHSPQSTEEKHDTLSSVGCGLRANIPEKSLSVRLEFGWPLTETPSDGDHLHTWVEVSKIF